MHLTLFYPDFLVDSHPLRNGQGVSRGEGCLRYPFLRGETSSLVIVGTSKTMIKSSWDRQVWCFLLVPNLGKNMKNVWLSILFFLGSNIKRSYWIWDFLVLCSFIRCCEFGSVWLNHGWLKQVLWSWWFLGGVWNVDSHPTLYGTCLTGSCA